MLGSQDEGWNGPWRQVDTRTAEGVRVGDPLSSVIAAYPGVAGGSGRTDRPPYFWSVGEFPVSYAFVTDGTDPQSPVPAIVSGYDCGD